MSVTCGSALVTLLPLSFLPTRWENMGNDDPALLGRTTLAVSHQRCKPFPLLRISTVSQERLKATGYAAQEPPHP